VANADDEQHRSFDRPGRIIATASGGKTAGCLTTARRTRMALQIRRVRARGGLEHCQLWLLRARAADLRMPVGVATLNGTLCYSAIMSAAKHELDVGPKTRSPPRKMLHRALVGVGLVLKKKARAPALPMR
jgi:hypothetical protein